MNFVHRYLRVYVKWSGHQKHFLSWDKAPNNRSIEMTSPFTTGVNPDMNSLTLYNLTKDEFNYFQKGRQVAITAGFYNSDASAKNGGLITTGTIKSMTPMSLDGVDRSIQINFNHFPDISEDVIKVKKVTKVRVAVKASARKKAGTVSVSDLISAYSKAKTVEYKKWLAAHPKATSHERGRKQKEFTKARKKYNSTIRKKHSKKTKTKKAQAHYAKQVHYANLSYKKGTKASTIIKDIAKRAHIPLGAVKLNYDHKYANGFTVSGKPLSAIKKVADGANTDIVIEGSKLYIREITTGQKATLKLNPETGLISHPTPSDDGAYDGQKFEAQALMRKEVRVGALVYIDDGVKNYGKCVILSGQREYTTSTSTVTFQFVPYNAYKKANAASLKKAKANAAKDKAKAKLKEKNDRAKDKVKKDATRKKRRKRKTKKKGDGKK
ncbi:hypothetical protein FC56_GL000294 [Lentilactobacillus senioris DSM 24302 = JCM 17472]|uniref:Uncharacterized protein n=1 Tax=Lentilactobacillus senioris DSM 24302 = JCM 17472 TaxID=1423802 RepID=A0A0R2D0S4_9LACO|nr:hypothetical protein [Lentilactobacillus senioris]KRM93580.1 hypothetical protein FC56_GL000294 [Lentilactobacillus senioris DSM 24302 = JCM 17472]